MTPRSMLSLVLLVSVVSVRAGEVAGDEPPPAKPVGLVGVLRSMEEGDHFVFKAKGGNYRVEWNNKTRVTRHTGKPLNQVEDGSYVWILGVKQAETPGEGGGSFPPMVSRITAVVVADTYEPPPVPTKLATSGIGWIQGEMKKRSEDREFWLEESQINTAGGRVVLVVDEVRASELEKGDQLFVAGYLDDSDRKNKQIHAVEIIAIAAKFNPKEYPLAFDFKNRKPAPKKSSKKPKKGDKPDF